MHNGKINKTYLKICSIPDKVWLIFCSTKQRIVIIILQRISVLALQKQSFANVFQIGVFKNSANFTGKHLCLSLFLIKRLQHRCFPIKFAKIFKNTIFYKTPPVAASAFVKKCSHELPTPYKITVSAEPKPVSPNLPDKHLEENGKIVVCRCYTN